MKAVMIVAAGKVAVVEVPTPELKEPDDVKIKVAYTAICGDDQRFINGDLSRKAPFPVRIGHEISGVVEALGPEATVKGLKVGDRVTGNFVHSCGKCHYCVSGNEHACNNLKTNTDAMAEYVVWKERQVFKIPAQISLREACLTEPLSACIRGIERCNIRMGDNVAIIGGSGIGLLLLQLAIRSHAASVTVIEPVKRKRMLALALGADHVIDPDQENVMVESLRITNTLGYNVVVEASGNERVFKFAFNILGRLGTLLIFSMYHMHAEVPLNLLQLYWNEATILASYTSLYTFPKAIAMLPKINLNSLITAEFPISEAPLAFAERNTGLHPRVLINYQNTNISNTL